MPLATCNQLNEVSVGMLKQATRFGTLLVMLSLLGCGTPAATSSNTGVQPTGSESNTGPLLKRRDAPPDGFKQQLATYDGGTRQSCIDHQGEETPLGYFDDGPMVQREIGRGFWICFAGFVPDQNIEATVNRPDGTIEQEEYRVYPDGSGGKYWLGLPGSPLGGYTITATQGERQATVSFTLYPASGPRIAVTPNVGLPGTTFQIYLAGYQPNQVVQMHLYRSADYVTALSTIQVNERGESDSPYVLTTESDDQEGVYLVTDTPVERVVTSGDRTFNVVRLE